MPKIFWKYKDEFEFFVQLIILIIALLFTTLARVGWDWSKVNYTIFGIMTFYSLYAKSISMNYAFNIALRPRIIDSKETNEIRRLEDYIVRFHHSLIDDGKMTRFNRALMYRNYIFRIRNLQIFYESKSRNNPKKRMQYAKVNEVIRKMKNLLDLKQYNEFDKYIEEEEVLELINIKKVKRSIMKKSNANSSVIFSTKGIKINEAIDGGFAAFTFNKWAYSFSTQAMMLVLIPVLQFTISGLTSTRYDNSMQMWIDLIFYISSLSISLFTGFRTGTSAAQDGYKTKLQQRINAIQEIEEINEKIPEAS